MYSLTKFIKTISLIALTLGCFGLSPQARAVCQEGCLTNQNTVLGEDALASNTSGNNNTATGAFALGSNTIGYNNTAIGASALSSNTNGIFNTAIGASALSSNTNGSFNTAIGDEALERNKGGFSNTASGYTALFSNTSGNNNTANGAYSLYNNTTGGSNTASGEEALYENTTGTNNLAMGHSALEFNTVGKSNTALGNNALVNNTTGNNNIALGASAGINLTTGGNNIDIGAFGAPGESNTIRIGRAGLQTAAYITGVSGTTVPGGVTVVIDSTGHLGTSTSSVRYKDDIQPMGKASEAILGLQPVTFHYKKELDPAGIPQFGLVAERVEKVNPDLVARDEQGKPYTVRYEAVNAMLLNEFLKEHRKGEQQDRKIEELETTVVQLRSALKEQAAQIQKVSDRIGAQAPDPRVVAND